jgi:hypothetical protein
VTPHFTPADERLQQFLGGTARDEQAFATIMGSDEYFRRI